MEMSLCLYNGIRGARQKSTVTHESRRRKGYAKQRTTLTGSRTSASGSDISDRKDRIMIQGKASREEACRPSINAAQ